MLSVDFLETVAVVNSTTCFFIGSMLNRMLIGLILRHYPTELSIYSRILLQIAVVNILYLTAAAL